MLLLLYIIHAVAGNILFSVILTYSNETPPDLLSQFVEYPVTYEIFSNSSPSDLLKFSTGQDILILDISCNPLYFNFLDKASELLGTQYLTITDSINPAFSQYRYFAHLDQSLESQKLLNLTTFLGWKKFTILSSLRNQDFRIASEIKSKNTEAQINFYYYEEVLTDTKADFLIKRKIKADGVKFLLVIDSGSSFKVLEQKLHEKNVIKNGFYLLVSSKTIYNLETEGALVLSEPGTEASKSEANYHYVRVNKILQSIPPTINFRVFLKKLCLKSELCTHSLANIQQSNAKKVGFITDSVTITDKIIYPGNSTIMVLDNIKNKIVLSIANGTSYLYHQGFDPFISIYYRGAEYAVMRSNKNNEIENFDLELFSTDCGNLVYEENWFKKCFSEILPKMGIAYLTGLFNEVLYGNLLTLRALNHSIPQITPIGQDVRIYDKNLNPEIVSLSLTLKEYLSNLIYLLRAMKWESVNIIGLDGYTSTNVFNIVKSFLTSHKITIVSPDEAQIFPENYTRNDFKAYENQFKVLKNTLCRIFVMIAFDSKHIIEGLYDVGLRKGDFIGLIHFSSIGNLGFQDEYQYKVENLVTGSLLHKSKDFVGEFGKKIKNEILSLTNQTTNFCVTFDSVLTVKESILHLMAIGEDFDDSKILMNYIRILKAVGCTGKLQIDNYSNFRANGIMSLEQISYDKLSGTMIYNEVIIVDKYGQNPVQISSEIDWSVDINQIPTNFIERDACGLDERLIKESIAGRNLVFIISAVILVISLVSAIVSTKLFDCKLPEIEKNSVIGISERFFLSFFMFEFFQLSLEGNRKGVLYEYVSDIYALAGFDFITFFHYESDQFWKIMIVILTIELTFCILCCIEIFMPKRCYEKSYFCSKIQDFNQIFLPVIGHIGFMPLISMSLKVFDCREGIGSDLVDSYLSLDCKTFCYKGKHKTFAILSCVSIICFMIPATILRPYLEKISCSRIRTKPIYLGTLSVFQVIIALASLILSFGNTKILGFIVALTIFFFSIYTLLNKPYNYLQAKLIQVAILSISFWDILLGCFYLNFGSIVIKVVQVVGIGFILVVIAIRLAKLENVFISETNFPISNLIRFQFSKNSNNFLKSDTKNIDLVQMNKLNYLEE